MKIEVAGVGPCKMKVHVEVPPEEVSEKLQGRFRELQSNVALPGFRQGRAPLRLVERRFEEQVMNETKATLIAESYKKAVDDNKLKPLGDPDIDPEKITLERDKPFVFDAEVEVTPKFELPEYKRVKVARKPVDVSEQEVDAVIEDLRRRSAQQVPVEEGTGAEEGHILVADLSFSAGDEELWKGENVSFRLAGNAIGPIRTPELLETLKGSKLGDEKQLPAGFPEDFREEKLKGKQGMLKVKVNEIKREELPEMNDAWAKQWGSDSVAALRERAAADAKQMKEEEVRKDIDRQIVEKLLSGADFELPDGLVERLAKRRAASYRFQLLYQGVPAEEIQKQTEEIEKVSRGVTERSLKAEFFFEDIAEKENLQPTENEVERWIQAIAARRGVTPHRYRKDLEEKEELDALRHQVLEAKVLQFLRDNAEIVGEGGEEAAKPESSAEAPAPTKADSEEKQE